MKIGVKHLMKMKSNILNEYLTNLKTELSSLYNSVKTLKGKIFFPSKKALKCIIYITLICSGIYLLISYDVVQFFLVCGMMTVLVLSLIYALFFIIISSINEKITSEYSTLLLTIMAIIFLIGWIICFNICEIQNGSITF